MSQGLLWKATKGMRVFVYRNLREKVWSVRAVKGENKGRVIFSSPYIELHTAIFKVSESGRQRVLKEQRKNVHAGVEGHLRLLVSTRAPWYPVQNIMMAGFADFPMEHDGLAPLVSYNPYKSPYFHLVHSGDPIHCAYNGEHQTAVTFHSDGKVSV